MKIYFDNAATTPIDREVLGALMPYLTTFYGNPSSSHGFGRQAREAIETSRAQIGKILNTPSEAIYFTSGATEALNWVITAAVNAYELRHVITSPTEHKAVLQPLRWLQKEHKIQLHYVELDDKGQIDTAHLQQLLKEFPHSLVALMHGNNEIGNLHDLEWIGHLCQAAGALFLSDTTQTIGKYSFDLQCLPVDFLVGSGHKFHAQKGVGFVYVSPKRKIKPLLHGGGQERSLRSGTENVAAIVGIGKALEVAYHDLDAHEKSIRFVKNRLIKQLENLGIGCTFNGESASSENSLYTLLNVAFPALKSGESLLSYLDLYGIAASGGSACSNLQATDSHVLTALQAAPEAQHIRFSFSKYNTPGEVDYVTQSLNEIYENDRRTFHPKRLRNDLNDRFFEPLNVLYRHVTKI